MEISGKNYFEIFSLEESFQIDVELLNRQFKKLQSAYHPDRFSASEDSQRLQALQASSIVNEAYQVLRSPLKRAGYLLTLRGVDPEANNQADLGEEFLLEQMQWRDKLERAGDAQDLDALDDIKAAVDADKRRYLEDFEKLYGRGDFKAAKPVYSRLQFIFKLGDEIDRMEEKLLDY